MKPLTIEELKTLEVLDWMWIKILIPTKSCKGEDKYVQIQSNVENGIGTYDIFSDWLTYEDYGKTWLAYKNKEQAEAKGEIVDIEDTFCCAMVGTTEQGEKYVSLEDYEHDIKKLGNVIKEYRRKLENGEMIDTTKYFYEKERKPNGECRYLICKYDTVSKGIYDFCDTRAEAERRIVELKGEKA